MTRKKPDWQSLRLRLFPQPCVLCQNGACVTPMPICPDCAGRFRALLREPCGVCSRPASECDCLKKQHLHALFWYRSPDSRRIVRSLKYRADRAEARALGELLASLCTGRYDAVTYVPRSRARVRQYGYDQARLLAKAVADRLELPLLDTLVSRSAVEQKMLSASQREKSMRGRYAALPSAVALYPRLLLVDDVSTTGATLRACASLLRQAGARTVTLASLAKTPQPKQ